MAYSSLPHSRMTTTSDALGGDAVTRPSWQRYVWAMLAHAGALALVVLAVDAFVPQWLLGYEPGAGAARGRLVWVLGTAAVMTAWNAWLQRLDQRASRAQRR